MKSSDKITKVVLFDIDYTMFDTAHYKRSNQTQFHLYKEVQETLYKLQKFAQLGIFSEGILDFQKRKLQKTELDIYFRKKHMHIVERKIDVIKTVLKKYNKIKQLFLVDDRLTILHLAKNYMPSIFTIWVKRGEYAVNQRPIEGFTADAEVEDLYDLVHLIANQ